MSSKQAEKSSHQELDARERRKEQNRIAQQNLRKRRLEQQQQQQQQKRAGRQQERLERDSSVEDQPCSHAEQLSSHNGAFDSEGIHLLPASNYVFTDWDSHQSASLPPESLSGHIPSKGFLSLQTSQDSTISPNQLYKEAAVSTCDPQTFPFMVPSDPSDPPNPDQVVSSASTLSPHRREAPYMTPNASCPPSWKETVIPLPPSRPRTSELFQDEAPALDSQESFLPQHRRGSSGKTALHLCTEKGYTTIVRYILERGAEPDTADSFGLTSLHYAARNGHTDVAAVLLEAGADIDATDSQGWTALHMAADVGHDDVVKLLIDEDADLNAAIEERSLCGSKSNE